MEGGVTVEDSNPRRLSPRSYNSERAASFFLGQQQLSREPHVLVVSAEEISSVNNAEIRNSAHEEGAQIEAQEPTNRSATLSLIAKAGLVGTAATAIAAIALFGGTK